jgi:hypothetical protein
MDLLGLFYSVDEFVGTTRVHMLGIKVHVTLQMFHFKKVLTLLNLNTENLIQNIMYCYGNLFGPSWLLQQAEVIMGDLYVCLH